MNDTPAWLDALVESTLTHVTPALPPAPIGLHLCLGDDDTQEATTYEVTVFYGKTEVLRGGCDGHTTQTPFWLDLAALTREFDSIDSLTFQSHPLHADDELGTHIAIQGQHLGYTVRLNILAAAPSRFPVARHADTECGEFVNLW